MTSLVLRRSVVYSCKFQDSPARESAFTHQRTLQHDRKQRNVHDTHMILAVGQLEPAFSFRIVHLQSARNKREYGRTFSRFTDGLTVSRYTSLRDPDRLNTTIPAVIRPTQRYSARVYLFFAKSTPKSMTGIICCIERHREKTGTKRHTQKVKHTKRRERRLTDNEG